MGSQGIQKFYGDPSTGARAMRMSQMEGARLEDARKLLKPQVEKRRRERINDSLEKLRVLLSQTMKIEKLKNPKIEKAEILECTVQFLQSRMKHREVSNSDLHQDYQSGYQHCLQTTLHFLNASQPSAQVSKDFLLQRSLPPNHVAVPLATDQPPATIYRLNASACKPTSTHCDCKEKSSVDQTYHLAHIHGGEFTEEKGSAWRPWV
ncbi:transcription factor HES-7.1-B-like [Gastrophryne carolinensis]